ncbi:MAG: hypothetical protein HY270_08605 [Deltaproteobacteria bacterium]|nr:hypothetical protein [Deltaproteobacteria bacterium]
MNHPPLRILLPFVLIALNPGLASAYATGINGYSGKSRGVICNSCHTDETATAPIVHFEGPTSVAPDATATFQFVVQSQSSTQTFSGFDVAATGGTLAAVAGQGEFLLAKEITHTAPKANDSSGTAMFELSWQAPSTPGSYTLYGAGNSVNGDGSERVGDHAAAATIAIQVGAAEATPTPTMVPTSSASPTAPLPACVGDCNGDVEVTVDELILGVNMAAGTGLISACPVFDANGDGEVTIDELLLAVNAALNGCPM